jgi:two-component system sporulation sensor kinase A
MSAQLYDNKRELQEFHNLLNDANRRLITSKSFLSALISDSPNSLVVASEDGQIMIFSREAMKIFGFDSDREIIGRDVQELFAQDVDDLMTTPGVADAQKGKEALCWRQDKTMFPAFVTITPIEVGESGRKAFLYIVRDISDSKSFQQMMIRLNRNYTKGEMAGDIAHDINNYLAVLLGNIELIPMFLKKSQTDKVDQTLEQMKKTLEKIGKYAAGLMESEHDEVILERIHINQVIENVLAFVRPQKKYAGIKIEANLSTEIPAFDADSTKMQQMMVNLLSNSCDALVNVEGEKKIEIRTFLTNNPNLFRIEVSDNGPGVIEEKRENLFKSRFTTKRKGHGIGLITCRKIVDAHKGKVGFEFTGKTLFFVELPISRDIASSPETPPVPNESSTAPA